MKPVIRSLVLLLFFLAIGRAQTPCIEAAKQGKIEDCLKSTVKVTNADAMFVAVAPVQGYRVDPTLPYSMALEFCTKEQALAIVELIKFAAPGANLTIADTGTNYSFPPFRKLQYFNDGSMFAPRLYTIAGTAPLLGSTLLGGGSALRVFFEPGWFLNVERLIYGGSFDTQELGFPFGNTKLILTPQFGGASPKWVGQ